MFDHRWLTPREVESLKRDRSWRRTSLERRQEAALRESRRQHRREWGA